MSEEHQFKPIDNVTTDLLDRVLRMCDIELHEVILEKVIDVVELLEEKGSQVTLKDVSDLQAEWLSSH